MYQYNWGYLKPAYVLEGKVCLILSTAQLGITILTDFPSQPHAAPPSQLTVTCESILPAYTQLTSIIIIACATSAKRTHEWNLYTCHTVVCIGNKQSAGPTGSNKWLFTFSYTWCTNFFHLGYHFTNGTTAYTFLSIVGIISQFPQWHLQKLKYHLIGGGRIVIPAHIIW